MYKGQKHFLLQKKLEMTLLKAKEKNGKPQLKKIIPDTDKNN